MSLITATLSATATHTNSCLHDYAELVKENDHAFRGIECGPWQEESYVIG